jgi:hypothetical protein
MGKATQEDRIVNYMKTFGGITQLEALRDLGVMRLASRISDLRRKGHKIKSETVTVKNRFEEDCYVSRYSMEA